MTTETRHWTDYQVGQRVYADFHYRGKHEMTVKSVGRKYVRFENQNDEVVVEKGSVEIWQQNWGRIGTLYESEEAYNKDQATRKLRLALDNYKDWYSLPAEKIRAIAQILEIEG